MLKTKENLAGDASRGEVEAKFYFDNHDTTLIIRSRQASILASRFGLLPSTAAVIAEIAFPALATIGGAE